MDDIPPELRLFDEVSSRQLDLIQVLLFTREEFTHLPELYDIVGRERFLEFIDVFSGLTLQIPKREEFETAIRDTAIYLRIRMSPLAQRPRVVRALAERYNLDVGDVRRSYARLAGELRRMKHPEAPPDGEDFA